MPRTPAFDARRRLLVRVATMYYQEDSTQDEIGRALGLSRPKVQRLLDEARRTGVVQIRIVSDDGDNALLERIVEQRFGLRQVIAVDVDGDDARVTAALGRAAAAWVERSLCDNCTLGLSWGATLGAVVAALGPRPLRRARVVQINGALKAGTASDDHAVGLARRAASVLGAELHLVPAPGIVSDSVVRDALLRDAAVAGTLDVARHADLVLVGIGARAGASASTLDQLLAPEDLEELGTLGAVGDIALRFFDADGAPVASSVDRRVVGLDVHELRRLDVVGIAGGAGKYEAILAVLRGGLVRSLITDADTARRLAVEARPGPGARPSAGTTGTGNTGGG